MLSTAPDHCWTRGHIACKRRFFQDKCVKVSLFLAEGIQRPCGQLVLPSCVRDQVGLLRRFDEAGQLVGEERLQVASQQVRATSGRTPPGSGTMCWQQHNVLAAAASAASRITAVSERC